MKGIAKGLIFVILFLYVHITNDDNKQFTPTCDSCVVIHLSLQFKYERESKMKFAANVSWLFKEEPDLLKRLPLAKAGMAQFEKLENV